MDPVERGIIGGGTVGRATGRTPTPPTIGAAPIEAGGGMAGGMAGGTPGGAKMGGWFMLAGAIATAGGTAPAVGTATAAGSMRGRMSDEELRGEAAMGCRAPSGSTAGSASSDVLRALLGRRIELGR